MNRTIIEIPMKTNGIDNVLSIIDTTLSSHNFTQKIVDNETIWAKGNGVTVLMQCVAATFTGTSVLLQGWMKDAITGESDLEGFVAMLPKKKLKKILASIQNIIIDRNL